MQFSEVDEPKLAFWEGKHDLDHHVTVERIVDGDCSRNWGNLLHDCWYWRVLRLGPGESRAQRINPTEI